MDRQALPPAPALASRRSPRRAGPNVGGVGTIAIGAFVGLIGLAIPTIAPARECAADCLPAPSIRVITSPSPDGPAPRARAPRNGGP